MGYGSYQTTFKDNVFSNIMVLNIFQYNGVEYVWRPREAIQLLKAFQAIEFELASGLIYWTCKNGGAR